MAEEDNVALIRTIYSAFGTAILRQYWRTFRPMPNG